MQQIPLENFGNSVDASYQRPPVGELQRRIEILCEEMQKEGLDYYLIFNPDNVFYLTNFANYVHERPFILVLSRTGKMHFVIPRLEAPHVSMRAIGDFELVSYSEFPAPISERWVDRLNEILPVGVNVGIESTCPRFLSDTIQEEIKCIDIVDALRAIKSDYELARIQYSCNLATDAHNHFLQNAKIGQTMRQASGEISRRIMDNLIKDDPSVNIFATKMTLVFQPPSISHDPHNFTDINVALEPGGPNVSIVNGVMNGYGAEVERTFFLGAVPEAAKRPFDVMMEARRAVLELARPGVLMSDVDRASNDIFRAAGYEDCLLHRAGHGIGVTGHEGPFFAEGYDHKIQENMVFTVEPAIYLPGVGGFHHSDTIRITGNKGAILMTDGPTALEDLIFDR